MSDKIIFLQDLPMISLFAGALLLLIVSFVLGRLSKLRNLEIESNSIDALNRLVLDEQGQLEKLRLEKEGIFREALRAENSINDWKMMKEDHQQISMMRLELDEFEREESQRIDNLELRRADASQRLREIQTVLDQYPEEIIGDENPWKEIVAKRKEEFDNLQKILEQTRVELDEISEKHAQLLDEATKLESELENLKEERDKVKTELENKITECKALEAVSNATISFPDETLSVTIKEMPADTAEHSHSDVDKLSAFRSMPECLANYGMQRQLTNEEELLSKFESALEEYGLVYPKRMVRAFHTALKVNDLSPLTVLSGLSGTGKSQLPRAYARYFGIHFLHVPVEPGWDSPQDILGFYDFVAERYRPTDRARALGHFDGQFGREIGIDSINRNWKNRMLIILLDEMNLARTEYYFSEFLSRLEMRPPREINERISQTDEDARIAIDLPYAKDQKPKHLYIPHNVLWIGTLNEDETTQALSDKVLDRANSIRFAPPDPKNLREHSTAPKGKLPNADGYLPYEEWLKWSKLSNSFESKNQDEINQVLEQLATTMQKANRGFGYRIAQSINAYINRYPGEDFRPPMVDQINMRLLPKLAGVELSHCHDTLSELSKLSEDLLGDEKFAEALREAEKKSGETEIFTWHGFSYSDDSR